MANQLFYGDNLEVLRQYIKDETIDLCYIDPPFNSQRNYYQVDHQEVQSQAFIDTWIWDEMANQGLAEIETNYLNHFPKQSIALISGLIEVLGKGSLLAYLVSMTLRIAEIYRVLKPTGSFYLHCDPTASHYLKLVLDAVFCPQKGEFINEIIWCYKLGGRPQKGFPKKHDVILFYAKSNDFQFFDKPIRVPYESDGGYVKTGRKIVNGKEYKINSLGKIPEDWWFISALNRQSKERLGYPTQKPEALLERIIQASSNEGDLVLDAYCGSGTTIAVAQKLGRNWIGIDLAYPSISLILKRLENSFGSGVLEQIELMWIPQD